MAIMEEIIKENPSKHKLYKITQRIIQNAKDTAQREVILYKKLLVNADKKHLIDEVEELIKLRSKGLKA